MRARRWSCLVLLLIALPVLGSEAPHWSVEFKGGQLTPQMDNFADYYGQESITYVEAGAAYKLWRQIEAGVSVGYSHARGHGLAELHGVAAGTVDYELLPVNAALQWRGIFSENQWVVPYVGGGVTRMGYRQSVSQQKDVTGSANGTHARAGVQLLLDVVDRRSAANAEGEGIKNTYLVIEYLRTDVKKEGVQLGGSAVTAGVLIEF